MTVLTEGGGLSVCPREEGEVITTYFSLLKSFIDSKWPVLNPFAAQWIVFMCGVRLSIYPWQWGIFYVTTVIVITALWYEWHSGVLVVLLIYHMLYIGSKTTATALETCMTYIYVIQGNNNRGFMTYMYIIQAAKGLNAFQTYIRTWLFSFHSGALLCSTKCRVFLATWGDFLGLAGATGGGVLGRLSLWVRTLRNCRTNHGTCTWVYDKYFICF